MVTANNENINSVEIIDAIDTFQCIKCKKYFNSDDDRGACYGNYTDCYYDLCSSCNPIFNVAKDESVCLKHLKRIVGNNGFRLVNKNEIMNRNIVELIFDYVRKPNIPFAISKQKSLSIMEEIISHLSYNSNTIKDQYDGPISINEKMDWKDCYDSDDSDDFKTKIIDFKHKIAIIEIDLQSYSEKDDIDDINEQHEFYKSIKNKDWNRSTAIEIHSGSYIKNDQICLSACLHNTSASSDLSYPTFSYDELYNCWIIKDSFWAAPNGIDFNGIVTILDFSEYK